MERLKVLIWRAPQGLTRAQWEWVGRTARERAGHLGADIRAHGSRVRGSARADSDLDLAIRVRLERFEAIINDRALSTLSSPTPGSNLAKTRQRALEQGMIQAGEARLTGLRRELQRELGIEVDISIIRVGGSMDRGPWLGLP